VVRDRQPELAEDADVALVARAVVDLPRDGLEVDDRAAERQARAEAQAQN